MKLDEILQNDLEYFLSVMLISLSILVYYSKLSTRFKFLFLSVITIQALALILLPNKKSEITGYLIFLVGMVLLVLLMKSVLTYNVKENDNILNYLIGKDFFNQSLFVIIGLLIIFTDIILDFFSQNEQYGAADNLLILSGLSWIFYYNLSGISAFMRNYIFIFLNLCPLLLFFPILIIYVFSSNDIYDSSTEWDTFLISHLLAVPLSKIINILGIYSFSDGVYVSFELSTGILGKVHIAQACTGYYSSIIFITSLITYFVVEKKNWDKLSSLLLGAGIMSVYLSNLLRMTLVVLAGHYYGMEALYWTHLNVGWIIFMFFILIFWSIIFKIYGSGYKNTHTSNVKESET